MSLDEFRMARVAIESAGRGSEYGIGVVPDGRERGRVIVSTARGERVTSFAFKASLGGVVAVRIRKLVNDDVMPLRWAEHMPGPAHFEMELVWEVGIEPF